MEEVIGGTKIMQDICPKDMGEHDWQPYTRTDGKQAYRCIKCGWVTAMATSPPNPEPPTIPILVSGAYEPSHVPPTGHAICNVLICFWWSCTYCGERNIDQSIYCRACHKQR